MGGSAHTPHLVNHCGSTCTCSHTTTTTTAWLCHNLYDLTGAVILSRVSSRWSAGLLRLMAVASFTACCCCCWWSDKDCGVSVTQQGLLQISFELVVITLVCCITDA